MRFSSIIYGPHFLLQLCLSLKNTTFKRKEENSMVLRYGKMTSKELAEWFGVGLRSYTNKAATYYLEKLKMFASFEKVYGGVIINEIYYDTYDKGISFDDEYFNQEIERSVKENNGLASISGIALKAQLDEDRYKKLSYSQVERRMSTAGQRHYGKYGSDEGGLSGKRTREWAIKLDDYNNYRSLTQEEYNYFVKLVESHYGNAGEQIILKQKFENQLRNKEITSDEYFALIDSHHLDFFAGIIQSFKEKFGKQLVLATEYEMRAWSDLSQQEQKNLL